MNTHHTVQLQMQGLDRKMWDLKHPDNDIFIRFTIFSGDCNVLVTRRQRPVPHGRSEEVDRHSFNTEHARILWQSLVNHGYEIVNTQEVACGNV